MILRHGYTSDITNRIDGKKYLISTAQDKKGGGWQTAVLKHRLFGIPNLFHPAMFIGAPDEEHARQVHARVEEIVAELPCSEWESAKWELFREILDKAFPEPGASAHTVLPNTEGADWSVFHGVPNIAEVLLKKAGVIARLIEIHWDQGIDLASEFKMNSEYPKVGLGQDQMRRVRAETAVVFLRMIDEIAFGVLETEQRDKLMEGLKICVAPDVR